MKLQHKPRKINQTRMTMPAIDDNGWREIIKNQGDEIASLRRSVDNLAKELYFFKGKVLGYSMAISGAIGLLVAVLSKFMI